MGRLNRKDKSVKEIPVYKTQEGVKHELSKVYEVERTALLQGP